MMQVSEIREWLDALNDSDHVGVDEGGLSLSMVRDGKLLDGIYCECGGIPEEIENA